VEPRASLDDEEKGKFWHYRDSNSKVIKPIVSHILQEPKQKLCGSLPWNPPTCWEHRWPGNAYANRYPCNSRINRISMATNKRNMYCCEQCFHLGPPEGSYGEDAVQSVSQSPRWHGSVSTMWAGVILPLGTMIGRLGTRGCIGVSIRCIGGYTPSVYLCSLSRVTSCLSDKLCESVWTAQFRPLFAQIKSLRVRTLICNDNLRSLSYSLFSCRPVSVPIRWLRSQKKIRF
jgi:hypothetical protein